MGSIREKKALAAPTSIYSSVLGRAGAPRGRAVLPDGAGVFLHCHTQEATRPATFSTNTTQGQSQITSRKMFLLTQVIRTADVLEEAAAKGSPGRKKRRRGGGERYTNGRITSEHANTCRSQMHEGQNMSAQHACHSRCHGGVNRAPAIATRTRERLRHTKRETRNGDAPMYVAHACIQTSTTDRDVG